MVVNKIVFEVIGSDTTSSVATSNLLFFIGRMNSMRLLVIMSVNSGRKDIKGFFLVLPLISSVNSNGYACRQMLGPNCAINLVGVLPASTDFAFLEDNFNFCLIQGFILEIKQLEDSDSNNGRMHTTIALIRRNPLNLMLTDFVFEGVPDAVPAYLDRDVSIFGVEYFAPQSFLCGIQEIGCCEFVNEILRIFAAFSEPDFYNQTVRLNIVKATPNPYAEGPCSIDSYYSWLVSFS